MNRNSKLFFSVQGMTRTVFKMTCRVLFIKMSLDFPKKFLFLPSSALTKRVLTYLLTPWSRVLLEKLTSKLCS
jgi:hypothetical protein